MVIALYMRLSKEDMCLQQESNSIYYQRTLLKEYVSKHFKEYQLLEFVDDGYSGAHFNRPSVIKLLEYVHMELVDCIIVKDFSRFSRDYIELGSYMEQIFPLMGVRFISVNDHYDSEETQGGIGNIDISFRFLLYDLYSKDLSVKVKTALNVRKEKGKYISANSPFGYVKGKEDKHMLFIKEDEALIVRRIFDMALNRNTCVQIAKQFNREGIKTPKQFKMETSKINEKVFEWHSSTICHILKNEVYIGDIVYGKYYKKEVGGKNYLKPRSEWKVYYNHHEPIVTRQVFKKVQKNTKDVKTYETNKKHPLTGKLLCNCGKKLQLKKGVNDYFRCPYLYVTTHFDCIRKISAKFLEQYVLLKVNKHILQIVKNEKETCNADLIEYIEATSLSQELTDIFIDKILVHKESNIEIIWKNEHIRD